MILETCQLLCSVWHMVDIDHKIYEPCYKLTHKNHPCAVWARTSKDNYEWLCQLGIELCKEYTHRYGKTHKCEPYLYELAQNAPDLSVLGFTNPALAMPEMYKDNDPVEAYRTYYFFEKMHIHSWQGKVNSRPVPEWIEEMHGLFAS